MPAVQTAYSGNIRAGLEGQIGSERPSQVETRICERTDGISFGKLVVVGTGAKGATLPGAAAGVLGVTVRDMTLVAKEGQTVDKYQAGQNMAVLNEGDIWVRAFAAVTAGNQVFGNSTNGSFLAASAAAGDVAIAGSRWLTTGASGSLQLARFGRTYPTIT